MTLRRAAIVLVVVLAGVFGLYRWWGPRQQLRAIVDATGSPDQAALWEQAGQVPDGIGRLSAPADPIGVARQTLPPSQRVPPADVTLANVQTGARLLSTTAVGSWSYTGPATVRAIDEPRVTLSYGANQSLTLAARIQGRPLPVVTGETVQVDVREQAGPENRLQLLGIQAANGATLVTLFATSDQPVVVASKFGALNITVKQPLAPAGLVGNVQATIEIGAVTRALDAGQTAPFGTLQARAALTRHEPDPGGERGPYILEVVAWRPGP